MTLIKLKRITFWYGERLHSPQNTRWAFVPGGREVKIQPFGATEFIFQRHIRGVNFLSKRKLSKVSSSSSEYLSLLDYSTLLICCTVSLQASYCTAEIFSSIRGIHAERLHWSVDSQSAWQESKDRTMEWSHTYNSEMAYQRQCRGRGKEGGLSPPPPTALFPFHFPVKKKLLNEVKYVSKIDTYLHGVTVVSYSWRTSRETYLNCLTE